MDFLSRRDFLRDSALLAATVAAGSSLQAAVEPEKKLKDKNDELHVACIGVRGQGKGRKDGKDDTDGGTGATAERSLETGIEGAFNLMRSTPDGSLLAVTRQEQDTAKVQIVNGKSGEKLGGYSPTVPKGRGAETALSPDNTLVATVEAMKDQGAECIVLRDVKSGAEVRKLTADPQASRLEHLAFSPQGDFLVAAAGTKIAGWECGTGRRLYSWVGHESFIQGLVVFPGGKKVASVGRDDRLRVWNLATQTAEKEIKLEYGGRGSEFLIVSPDGTLAATVGSAKRDQGERDATDALHIWTPGAALHRPPIFFAAG